MWAHAYLEQSHFIQYEFHPPPLSVAAESIAVKTNCPDDPAAEDENLVSFALNGKQLLECLQIFGKVSADVNETPQPDLTVSSRITPQGRQFGSARSIESELSYEELGDRLQLILTDRQDSAITTCRFATFEPVRQQEADFMACPAVCKLIMKSGWLQDTLNEFSSHTETITIHVSPTKPYLALSASDYSGKTDVEYSNDTNVIEYFTCVRPFGNTYRFSLFSPVLKALGISLKTSIRVNDVGLLSMQFMIPSGDIHSHPPSSMANSRVSFVEYLISPNI
jgi:cell cycle checkpoint protein